MHDLHTGTLGFEWNALKDRWNRRKHGISFSEAATVFIDPHASLYFDPDHSREEDRFILLGMSAKARLLVVIHCLRRNGTHIRIISARKADAREALEYKRD